MPFGAKIGSSCGGCMHPGMLPHLIDNPSLEDISFTLRQVMIFMGREECGDCGSCFRLPILNRST